MNSLKLAASLITLTIVAAPFPAMAQQSAAVVKAGDTHGTSAERAAIMVSQMTLDEKLLLVRGYFGTDFAPGQFKAPDEVIQGSAGYVPGIPRLGIPPQWETDAGLGVATQGGLPKKRARTGLPSGPTTAATWDPSLAYQGGKMIGSEARATGFNVILGGAVNLLREPRNGRNFEYAGEDPLLAGTIVGAQIAGVQSNDIISTIKHYAVNDQETDRNVGNFILDESAMRMSDLLAFQIAIEQGEPGSVMCAYNKINGIYACEHPFLLTQVLRNEWNWPGYVMSDWGAGHSTADSANAGLDQESGFGLQRDDWFAADKLKAAIQAGEVSQATIDQMAGRILTAMFEHGVIDNPVNGTSPIDVAANHAVSQHDAEGGMVLLKNESGILPLATSAKRIAVIGGYADKGILSGGGSSQVYPEGENAVPGLEPTTWPGPVVYFPSSPLAELKKALPGAQIDFASGDDPRAAARLAQQADIAIVFGTQWSSESIDVAPKLDGKQDALVAAVAKAQPKTVVVLQNSGPLVMPWADSVPAIVEAWYPGSAGGKAIANVLTGKVNPSGHLPMTFPASLDQYPFVGEPRKLEATYDEGARVGYKWFDAKGLTPKYPFGHGLSYTSFAFGSPTVMRSGDGLVAAVKVTNTGAKAGSDVVQLYVSPPANAGWEAPKRLGGFAKVTLAPGESTMVGMKVDPRLLAIWDAANPGWTRAAGTYTVTAGYDSRNMAGAAQIELPAGHLPPEWKP